MKLIHGDCLEKMKDIAVDRIAEARANRSK